MLAFGGAGPVLACGAARAAGINRVIVPHLSAVFSAFGIGSSGLAHEYSVPMPDSAEDIAAVRDDLLVRARRDMAGEGVDPADCTVDTASRFVTDGVLNDQAWANGTPGDGAPCADLVVRAWHPLPTFTLAADDAGSLRPATPDATRRINLTGEAQDVPVHNPDNLTAGQTAVGPTLVAGDYLTCLVEPSWRFRVSNNLDLILETAP